MEILLSGVFIFLYVIVAIYLIFCFIRICKKAGYSPLFGILLIIPGINLIILGIMAFEKWPILSVRDRLQNGREETKKNITSIVCGKCGSKVNEKDKYCPQCGLAISETVCKTCGQLITDEMKYCVHCGADLCIQREEANKLFCPKCGSEISEDDELCRTCGFRIVEQTSAYSDNEKITCINKNQEIVSDDE